MMGMTLFIPLNICEKVVLAPIVLMNVELACFVVVTKVAPRSGLGSEICGTTPIEPKGRILGPARVRAQDLWSGIFKKKNRVKSLTCVSFYIFLL